MKHVQLSSSITMEFENNAFIVQYEGKDIVDDLTEVYTLAIPPEPEMLMVYAKIDLIIYTKCLGNNLWNIKSNKPITVTEYFGSDNRRILNIKK